MVDWTGDESDGFYSRCTGSVVLTHNRSVMPFYPYPNTSILGGVSFSVDVFGHEQIALVFLLSCTGSRKEAVDLFLSPPFVEWNGGRQRRCEKVMTIEERALHCTLRCILVLN